MVDCDRNRVGYHAWGLYGYYVRVGKARPY